MRRFQKHIIKKYGNPLKTNDDNKESRSPNYRLKSKTEFTNQTRKVFRSKFDVINETQDRKQLVFGKKPNYENYGLPVFLGEPAKTEKLEEVDKELEQIEAVYMQ